MSTAPGTVNTRTLAAKLAATMGKATANQGHGGLGAWPNEPNSSELAVEVKGVTFNWSSTFNYKAANGAQTKIPCLEVQFNYCWHESPTGPMDFKGAPMSLPYDQKGLPLNQQQRVDISADRLKGQSLGLLGREESDTTVLETEFKALLEAAKATGSPLMVKAYLEIVDKPAKGTQPARRNKTDFIRELVSGPEAAPQETADAEPNDGTDPVAE